MSYDRLTDRMAKQSKRDFAGPAKKYAGRVGIDQGPVQITRWQRPLTRAEHDRPQGAEGVDLHPERTERQSSSPPRTRKGTGYNR
jgi:hypothetical protein